MHELSIATNIVEISIAEVQKAGGVKVKKVTLEIGCLTCVEKEALNLALREAVINTILENTEFIVEPKTGIARCLNCKNCFFTDNLYDLCPVCNDFKTELIQGKEIKIKSLEII